MKKDEQSTINHRAYCRALRRTPPPYRCPYDNCRRDYRSLGGLVYHLKHYDHLIEDSGDDGNDYGNGTVTQVNGDIENIESQQLEERLSARRKGGRRRKLKRNKDSRNKSSNTNNTKSNYSSRRDTLTYAEAQTMVQVEKEGKLHRIPIDERLNVLRHVHDENEAEETRMPTVFLAYGAESLQQLPQPQFGVIQAPTTKNLSIALSQSYYRFIEKTSEELDEEIEYDLDDEDYCWFDLVNGQRNSSDYNPISADVFEFLMDRLEKESYFESRSSGVNGESHPYIDEDAVCCICNDGECQNSNAILFCDMCNLAVHQECYGVPYIPEGQWLCRRCLNSPSRPVDCIFCPSKNGAFKQTDDGRWAHVICGLWIPEVGFANAVFLEPIDSVDKIPAARWKLPCYLCKNRNSGACIQCYKTNCYTAFHVTCAQQNGLFLKMEPMKENGVVVSVKKEAYCHIHSPPGHATSSGHSSSVPKKINHKRKAADRRAGSIPIVSVPKLPVHKVTKLSSKLNIQRKAQFIQMLINYWILKRQSRNGVPLLRRLQTSHPAHPVSHQRETANEAAALKEQLEGWRHLRQDLERARLLVELVRKREKLKREHMRVCQKITDMRIRPLYSLLKCCLRQLKEKDYCNVFAEPVSVDEVSDYFDFIDYPMDLSTMDERLENGYYQNVEEFEADFYLMINNCITYNQSDTFYYKWGIKIREVGRSIFKELRRSIEYFVDPLSSLHKELKLDNYNPFELAAESDTVFDRLEAARDQLDNMKVKILEERLSTLNDKLKEIKNIKHSGARAMKSKNIKKEIAATKRRLNKLKETTKPQSDSAKSNSQAVLPLIVEESNRCSGNTKKQTKIYDFLVKTVGTSSNNIDKKEDIILNVNGDFDNAQSHGKRKLSIDIQNDNECKKSAICAVMSTGNLSNADNIAMPSCSVEYSELVDNDNQVPETSYNSAINDVHLQNGSSTCEKSDSLQQQASKLDLSVETPPSSVTGSLSSDPFCNGTYGSGSRSSSIDGDADCSSLKGSSSEKDAAVFVDDNFMIDDNVDSVRVNGSNGVIEDSVKCTYNHLDLVWAKSRGFPSYPALVIDPKTPSCGIVHNGIPIPGPPAEVLKKKVISESSEAFYLVLFFDVRRTWQWLPHYKLHPLGVNDEFDKGKLVESRKPSMRRNVLHAFERASEYIRGVKLTASNGSFDNVDDTSLVNGSIDDIQNNIT